MRAPSFAWQAQAEHKERTHGLLLSEDTTLDGMVPSLLDPLTDDERTLVRSRGIARSFQSGEPVFVQGAHRDGVYLIEAGHIRVFYVSPSGREITLAYWNPGNFVGGPDVFGRGMHTWSGTAMSPCSILAINGKDLRGLVAEIPALAIGLIEGLSFKGACYSALAQMLGTHSVTERLVHLLLRLTELHGVPGDQGTLIAAAFTHADLASIVGATRQWVTATLARLEDRGLLAMRNGRIFIIDASALAGSLESRRTLDRSGILLS